MKMAAIEPSQLTIKSEGADLIGTYYAPGGRALANLVLHGATGVPQRYYSAFANWAASRGVGVLTYDYRDFGASQTRPVKQSRATFADWAIHDQAAAEKAIMRIAPQGPI